ncbi:hypothetical protein ABXT57_02070 [Methylophilaceae bacterium Uisw_097]
MKKTILKYSSLLALLGTSFFSTQTFAAECQTGASPDDSCTIDVSDITYTLTGDINTNTTDNIIDFGAGANSNTLNFRGNITSEGLDARAFSFSNNDGNTLTMTGNIITEGNGAEGIKLFPGVTNANINMTGNITTTGILAYGIYLDTSDSNNTTMTGNISTEDATGIILSGSSANTTNMIGSISTQGVNAHGISINTSTANITTMTGNISTTDLASYGILVSGSDSNTTNITGNISSTKAGSHGIYLIESDSNTTIMSGNITTEGIGAHGIFLSNSKSNNTINMTGNIISSGSNAIGIHLQNNSDSNFINMTGNITSSETGAYGISINSSDSNTVTMIGNISTTGAGAYGVLLLSGSESNTINMTGNITTTANVAHGIYLNTVDSNTATINGNITTTGTDTRGLFLDASDSNNITINGNIITSDNGGSAEPIYLQFSDSNTITLSGKVQSLGGDQAISIDADSDSNTFNIQSGSTFLGDFENLGTNTVITNQGTMDGIVNTGSIATFNNAQTGATYSGTLPVNYNIIINSPTAYGQMFVTSEAGSTNFGLSSVSTNLFNGKYSNVMTGVSDGSVGATRSGSLEGNGTSSAGTANWVLSETASGSSAWDLNITGDYVYFGSVATLQSSVNNTATAMRGAFNSITSSMNFANMTTYDCNLFGNNGGCVSVGGRYTGTDNPDTTATAVVAKAGYKFNEHFRYGAFVDQTANSKTGNVDLDMNTPMVGLMGVWNQNPDQLGMQVKIANTYQSTDATITRNGLGNDFSGDTDINAQSYVAELSWHHLNDQKNTLLQPFVATRYAIIDQDGYSDGLVNYGSVEQKTLTALAGVKAFYQYSPKMTYMGSLGVEHDLDEDADDLSVSVSGVSGLTAASMTDGGEDKTRLLGSVGARFFVTPNQRLEGKLMYEQLRYNNADNTTAYVNYTIGF